MTREEAVIILDGFKNNPLFSDTHVQALDMAISALSEKDKKFYYDHGYAQAKRDLSENKGEWIKDEKMSIVFDIYRCSRCSADGEPRYKFCPNCGAKMKGEADGKT